MSQPESSVPGRVPVNSSEEEDLPDIYLGAIRRNDDRPEVVVTEIQDANAPEWSRRRAIVAGLFVGGFLGSVFFAGYAGTSAWICSARLDCGHWAPIAIVSGAGALVSTIAGGVGGYLLHKIYRLFKVT